MFDGFLPPDKESKWKATFQSQTIQPEKKQVEELSLQTSQMMMIREIQVHSPRL
jgi:hypothetical protein